jgi:hypothetical protein
MELLLPEGRSERRRRGDGQCRAEVIPGRPLAHVAKPVDSGIGGAGLQAGQRLVARDVTA